MLSLVSDWRSGPAPQVLHIKHLRHKLLTTAIVEMEECLAQDIPYDPLHDIRFLWASNWLDHHEDKSIPLDQDLAFAIHLMLDEPIFSRRQAAANDA